MTFRTLSIAALTAAIAAPAFAADNDSAQLVRTRDITDAPIYSMGEGGTADAEWNIGYKSVMEGWNRIGEIEDVVLDANGRMVGIVAEIGGFLDVGDKHVMIVPEDVRLVPVDDKSYAFVTRRTEKQLEEMEGLDEGFWN